MTLSPSAAPRSRRNASRAFTLIELIVSCGITMMLVVIVINIVNGVLDHSRSVRQSSDSGRELSLALDTLAEDLETLLIPQQNDATALRLKMETVNGLPQPWLCLLTYAPDADGGTYPGTARAVSFRVADQDPVPGGTSNDRSGLYRAIASASATHSQTTQLADPQADFWDTGSNPSSHEWQDLLADRVYSLQLRFQRADTGAWIDPQEAGSEIHIDRHGTFYSESGGTPVEIPGGIRAIEASLVVLDEHGQQQVLAGVDAAEAALRYGRHAARRTIVLPIGIAHRP